MLDLTDPTTTLLLVIGILRDAGVDAAVYGGLALAAYGEPRETRDADFAVVGVSAKRAAEALRTAGIDVQVPFDHVVFGGNWVSRITLLGGDESIGLNTADLVEPRSNRFARLALARAMRGSLREQTVSVLSPEDFVLFKILSTRDRDLHDAASVMRALGADFDRGCVEDELRLLVLEIPDHDTAQRWARVIALSNDTPDE